MSSEDNCKEEKDFVEFRRKVRAAENAQGAFEQAKQAAVALAKMHARV